MSDVFVMTVGDGYDNVCVHAAFTTVEKCDTYVLKYQALHKEERAVAVPVPLDPDPDTLGQLVTEYQAILDMTCGRVTIRDNSRIRDANEECAEPTLPTGDALIAYRKSSFLSAYYVTFCAPDPDEAASKACKAYGDWRAKYAEEYDRRDAELNRHMQEYSAQHKALDKSYRIQGFLMAAMETHASAIENRANIRKEIEALEMKYREIFKNI